MKPARILLTTALSLSLAGAAMANTFGSVEPIPNPAVLDTGRSGTSPGSTRGLCQRGSCECGLSTT